MNSSKFVEMEKSELAQIEGGFVVVVVYWAAKWAADTFAKNDAESNRNDWMIATTGVSENPTGGIR